ncbi:hypothetical protein B0H17DRAFT_1143447 [Mycena rosella]|uniref:Uncharacterized protein n=1 Tax=Mycena rosella TaxID=1033263 RepID=A0AAD7G4F2_MYCRO|nr:hypothetical protein B0H17DRAFT_1143447 [Mycena rosella]
MSGTRRITQFWTFFSSNAEPTLHRFDSDQRRLKAQARGPERDRRLLGAKDRSRNLKQDSTLLPSSASSSNFTSARRSPQCTGKENVVISTINARGRNRTSFLVYSQDLGDQFGAISTINGGFKPPFLALCYHTKAIMCVHWMQQEKVTVYYCMVWEESNLRSSSKLSGY